jgi:hypothetical protein
MLYSNIVSKASQKKIYYIFIDSIHNKSWLASVFLSNVFEIFKFYGEEIARGYRVLGR